MVTVSSAFISSRRERIIFSVLSASGCAFKAVAFADVLRGVFAAGFLGSSGKTDLDNTDVARDHSFHCTAGAESLGARSLYYACGVNGFNVPVLLRPHFVFQLPSGFRRPVDDRFSFMPVRKTQAGARRCLGRGRGKRAKTLRRPVDHGDRHFGGDTPPVLPAVKLREVVGAHDPY